jgi:hypothetical protein
MNDPRDRKFAAALRLLSARVAVLERRAGIAPAANVMHDNRPRPPRVETDFKPPIGAPDGPDHTPDDAA